ncbi:prolyl oligopeptidase family serine peptidase, partial [Streptococcus pyogenes]
KGAVLDGSTPFLVTDYGGFGVSIQPYFAAVDSVLFERGVALAVANLRGGGEYGEAWHRGGNLGKKQNVFDDFAAVLEHLVSKK